MDEGTSWNRRRYYRDDDDFDAPRRGSARWRDPGREPMTGRWDDDNWRTGGWFDEDRGRYSDERGRRSQGGYGAARYGDARWSQGSSQPARRGSQRAAESSDPIGGDYGWNYGSSPEEQFYHGFGDEPSGRQYRGGSGGSGRGWSRDDHRSRSREDRGLMDRASDEVASWFGDEDAERRRAQDHRGRGPSGYTRSDERIREDVNDRLTDDPRVDATEVTVSVENGEVTLSGTVGSRAQKRRAEDCAEAVSGVRHVQNNIRVEERSSAHDTGHPTAFGETPSSYR